MQLNFFSCGLCHHTTIIWLRTWILLWKEISFCYGCPQGYPSLLVTTGNAMIHWGLGITWLQSSWSTAELWSEQYQHPRKYLFSKTFKTCVMCSKWLWRGQLSTLPWDLAVHWQLPQRCSLASTYTRMLSIKRAVKPTAAFIGEKKQ